jgi:hypothetical protein
MQELIELVFPDGTVASAVRVEDTEDVPLALKKLGLSTPTRVLVLVGGAAGLSTVDVDLLRSLFVEVLAPLAEELDASVVDGGTDSGVMRFMGQAHSEIGATFSLIGVAAVGTVALPSVSNSSHDAALLEPNHTHFILVPGSEWGDESQWIACTASALTEGMSSVTVLVNGGETAWEDVYQSVRVHRPVISIAGTGRTADVLAAALRGESTEERAVRLSASGLIKAVDLAAGAETLVNSIREAFMR